MKTSFDSRASGGTLLSARVKIFLAFFEKNLLMMPTQSYELFHSGVHVTLISSFLLGRKEKAFK
jgi:hypothetical protein